MESGEEWLLWVLLSEPDMLLLDEPTNHLDAESVAVERCTVPGTVVAITHDRLLRQHCGVDLELDRGFGFLRG